MAIAGCGFYLEDWKEAPCRGGGCADERSHGHSYLREDSIMPPPVTDLTSEEGIDPSPVRSGQMAGLSLVVIPGRYIAKSVRNKRGCWHGAFASDCCDEATGAFLPEFAGIFTSYRKMCTHITHGGCSDLNLNVRGCISQWCKFPGVFNVKGPKIHCVLASDKDCQTTSGEAKGGLGYQGHRDAWICEGAEKWHVFLELIHTRRCLKGHKEVTNLVKGTYSPENAPYSCQELCYSGTLPGSIKWLRDAAGRFITVKPECCKQSAVKGGD